MDHPTEPDWTTADEKTLRDSKAPWPKSIDELVALAGKLVERQHEYGTAVYAASILATADLNFVASKLGMTGFQVSCADLDILARTRHLERGDVRNYADLLYPQYESKFKGWADLLRENAAWLRDEARKLLASSPDAHKDVRAHWERLADGPT